MDKFSGSKKYLSILISIFLLVCSFAMLSGCHKHKYISENIEATCLKGAYIKSTCKKCGEIEISEETSAPLGHKFDGDICERCNYEREHIHSYKTEIIAPGCESEGYELSVCQCGDTKIGDKRLPPSGHNYINDKCTKCEHVREHVHVFKATLVPATCIDGGYLINECNCGFSEVGPIVMPPLGHSFIDDVCERCKIERDHQHNYEPSIVEPTCEAEGYIMYKCKCGDSYKSDEKMPPLGHNYVLDVCTRCQHERDHEHRYSEKIVQPTCVKPGYNLHECECGDSYKDKPTLALGHHYIDDKCTECGYEKEEVVIYSVEAFINGAKITEYKTDVFSEDFKIDLVINYGASLDDFLLPDIEWSFVEDGYGSAVTNDGTVSLGDFIGSITLRATVCGQNRLTLDIPVIVTLPEEIKITSIAATKQEGYTQEYIEGERFNTNSIALWGESDEGMIRITEYKYDDIKLTPDVTDIKAYYKDLVTEIPIKVSHKALQSIEIMFPASKTDYLEGECFNKDGMVVKAYFENSETILSEFDVNCNSALTRDMTEIEVSYTYNGITKNAMQKISVTPKKLLSISVDISRVRCIYTQGDSFDNNGLVVLASYENFGEVEVHNYSYSKKELTVNDNMIEISFTDEGITATAQIAINVSQPYTEISHLKILSPKDVSIIWSYSYMTNNGERIIDNTAHKANGLKFDRINGIYDIPMGAVVTATIKNPSVVNLTLNNEEQIVNYQEKTVTWTMGNADLVVIKSIYMSGENSVIRFAGQENEQSFLYEGNWNGYLTNESLIRLETIFADTPDHYYTYLINGALKRFGDLADIKLAKNSDITVIKNAVSSSAKELILQVGENEAYSIWVTDEVLLDDIPVFTKNGYNYEGWATELGGERIDQEALTEFIAQEKEEYKLYIRFEKEEIDYSDAYINQNGGSPTFGGMGGENSVQLIGKWQSKAVNEENTLECNVSFNADGTYTYEVLLNGIFVSQYTGEYRIDIEKKQVVVISVEASSNMMLVNPNELVFTLKNDKISANLVVILVDQYGLYDGYILVSGELEKTN